MTHVAGRTSPTAEEVIWYEEHPESPEYSPTSSHSDASPSSREFPSGHTTPTAGLESYTNGWWMRDYDPNRAWL